ncbi:hypothetical protein [Marinomonas fungiae]|uniref:hypothetical protein n=1 Tax=Marinomonas fungiae TaxID=1137284 RepID=UPI003A8D30BC
MASVGWITDGSWQISRERFEQFLTVLKQQSSFWRFKGILQVDKYFEEVNMTVTELHRSPSDNAVSSRFECIFSDSSDFESTLATINTSLF